MIRQGEGVGWTVTCDYFNLLFSSYKISSTISTLALFLGTGSSITVNDVVILPLRAQSTMAMTALMGKNAFIIMPNTQGEAAGTL